MSSTEQNLRVCAKQNVLSLPTNFPPLVILQQFIGPEPALVAHRGEAVNPVAEVEEGYLLGGADVVEGEDVEGARAAPTKVRVEEEVHRVHPRRREIDHAHADQPLLEPVADLEAAGDAGDEEAGVVALGTAASLWKTGGEKTLQEGDVLP